MIYRAVKLDGKAFLTGGDTIADVEKEFNEATSDELDSAPLIHLASVQIGAETFFVGSNDPVSARKKLNRLYEMARRVDQADAFFRVRQTDDGEFAEFVSPGLGYAVKAVSKYNREPIEYYIGAGTPWVRWDKEAEVSTVMFDQDAFDYEPRMKELNELGFTEPNVWYKAERTKAKTASSDKKKWVWKSLA